MRPNPHFTADLVTFFEEILYEKPHFLCCECSHFIRPKKQKTKEFLVFSRGINGNIGQKLVKSYYQVIQVKITFQYFFSNSFQFGWIFEAFLINIIGILMMSAKLATPGLLKICFFKKSRLWCHNRCPSCYRQNFITWLKLYCRCRYVTKVGNSSISMREVIII